MRCCLDNLYDQVVDGGLVILDSCSAWDGCAIAAHEFLGSRRLGHRIEGVVGRAEGVDAYESAVFRRWPHDLAMDVPALPHGPGHRQSDPGR